jgi:hypothetical protein
MTLQQGCQMAYFQTKNPNLGEFWRVLQWNELVYFTAIWSILQHFCIFYGHLVNLWSFGIFIVIWYFYVHLVYSWSFGKFMVIRYIYGHLVYLWSFGTFSPFWYIVSIRIWQPCATNDGMCMHEKNLFLIISFKTHVEKIAFNVYNI